MNFEDLYGPIGDDDPDEKKIVDTIHEAYEAINKIAKRHGISAALTGINRFVYLHADEIREIHERMMKPKADDPPVAPSTRVMIQGLDRLARDITFAMDTVVNDDETDED